MWLTNYTLTVTLHPEEHAEETPGAQGYAKSDRSVPSTSGDDRGTWDNNQRRDQRRPGAKRFRKGSTPTKWENAGEQTDEEIKFLALNTCGLYKRLQYREFTDFISGFDILCLGETKTDDSDIIQVPGYSTFLKNRTKLAKIRSGGIGLLVKDALLKYVSVVHTECMFFGLKLVTYFLILMKMFTVALYISRPKIANTLPQTVI